MTEVSALEPKEPKSNKLEKFLVTPDNRLTNFGVWSVTLADATHNLDSKEMEKEISHKVNGKKSELSQALAIVRGKMGDNKWADKEYWGVDKPELFNSRLGNNAEILRAGAEAAYEAAIFIKSIMKAAERQGFVEEDTVLNYCLDFGGLVITCKEELQKHPRLSYFGGINRSVDLRRVLNQDEISLFDYDKHESFMSQHKFEDSDIEFLTSAPNDETSKKGIVDDALANAMLEMAGRSYLIRRNSSVQESIQNMGFNGPDIRFLGYGIFSPQLHKIFAKAIGQDNFNLDFGLRYVDNISDDFHNKLVSRGIIERVKKRVSEAQQSKTTEPEQLTKPTPKNDRQNLIDRVANIRRGLVEKSNQVDAEIETLQERLHEAKARKQALVEADNNIQKIQMQLGKSADDTLEEKTSEGEELLSSQEVQHHIQTSENLIR